MKKPSIYTQFLPVVQGLEDKELLVLLQFVCFSNVSGKHWRGGAEEQSVAKGAPGPGDPPGGPTRLYLPVLLLQSLISRRVPE